jgi:hypothetical protein
MPGKTDGTMDFDKACLFIAKIYSAANQTHSEMRSSQL